LAENPTDEKNKTEIRKVNNKIFGEAFIEVCKKVVHRNLRLNAILLFNSIIPHPRMQHATYEHYYRCNNFHDSSDHPYKTRNLLNRIVIFLQSLKKVCIFALLNCTEKIDGEVNRGFTREAYYEPIIGKVNIEPITPVSSAAAITMIIFVSGPKFFFVIC
jgi:hypothetical protein